MPSQTIIYRIVVNPDMIPLADIHALLEKLSNFEPVLETMAQYAAYYQQQNFADQGVTFGDEWPPLAPSTIDEKKRLGYPDTPLVRTGNLRDAIGHTIVMGTDGISVTVGISKAQVPYAVYHDSNEPRKSRLPQRVLVAVTDEEEDELMQLLKEWFADGTGQAIDGIEIRSEVAVMSGTPTIYPYRQCLDLALRSLILTYAVPAINADLMQQMTAQGVATSKIPQFTDAQIVTGELMSIGEPTICIVDGGEDADFMSSRQYSSWLATQIQVKTPSVAGNAPEDFSLFFKVVVDTLRDLFNSPRGLTMQPVNPSTGHVLLPGGQKFQNCRMTGSRPLPFPNYSGDKITRCRGYLISHLAMVDYALDRPTPLGG
jgi:phage gpG-like protein